MLRIPYTSDSYLQKSPVVAVDVYADAAAGAKQQVA